MTTQHHTCAAFISAGMHRNTDELDTARDILGTGCLEFVHSAMEYVDYVYGLAEVGYKVTGDFPGVYDYEVSEEFGCWYVRHTLATKELPTVNAAGTKLRNLALNFFLKCANLNYKQEDQLHAAVNSLPLPAQPEI